MTGATGTYRLGVLLGDGIGPEVVPAAVAVVNAAVAAAGADVEWVELPVGRSAIDSHGSATPPSTVEARMTSGPALFRLNRRARKLVVPRAAPSWAFGSLRGVHSTPSTQTRRPDGATPPSPVASTRMSSNWPAAITPPSGGMIRIVVAAAARAGVRRARQKTRTGRMAR